MANFTAKDVQALREKTGCGMMDCKKALIEADGNMEKAIELLREKGLAAAAKKAGRIAAEGLVHCISENGVGVAIEVNSETDFVAKNADFVAFVDSTAKTIAKENPADVEALLALKLDGADVTVEEALREKILVIGENMKIRRFARYEGAVATYIHGGGRIGVMVKFEADSALAEKDAFQEMGRNVAMQIAAANPQYASQKEVSAETIAKETEILTAQAMNEGKPQNIAEKMVQGRIRKFYEEVCLLDQNYVKNPDIKVGQYIADTAKELGAAVELVSFVRFERGEGLEKREDNFADEVAGMIK